MAESPAPSVLLLLIDEPGSGGGISQYEAELWQSLLGLGCECTIISQSQTLFRRLTYLLQALRKCLEQKPTLIFCGHLDLLPVAWLLHRLFAKPIWLQIHGIEAWAEPSPLYRKLLKPVGLVTSVSRFTRKRFLNWSDFDQGRVRVLPNTIAGSPLPQRAISQVGPVLATVARLDAREAYKGHDRILAVLPELVQKFPNIDYLIVGQGDDAARLQQLSIDLGVDDHVTFRSSMTDEERDQLYEQIDLFVMPSTGEGFGIVFLEALVKGCRVLGFGEDGSVDPLRNGEFGMVSSEQTLAQDIGTLITHAADTDVSQRVLETFGIDNFVKMLDELILKRRVWQ